MRGQTFAKGQDLVCIRCQYDLKHPNPEKIITCDECAAPKPYTGFSTEMQTAFLSGEAEPMCCLQCLKIGNTLVDGEVYACRGRVCEGNDRPENQFLSLA